MIIFNQQSGVCFCAIKKPMRNTAEEFISLSTLFSSKKLGALQVNIQVYVRVRIA